nr:hypothetical protein KPHV_86290 [Kitasatospora purpeofusca]
MTPYESAPSPLVPTWAGILDHLGGGHEANRPSREVARRLIDLLPDAPLLALDAAWLSRSSVTRVVTEHGIRQIVHADAGYPADPGRTTHQLARDLDPACRTLYAEPDLYAHHVARCVLLDGQEGVVHAGLADGISGILEHPASTALLDPALPVAVLCPAAETVPDHVLADLLDGLARLLPVGGYLVIGQLSCEDPALASRIDDAMTEALDGRWGCLRTRDQLVGVLGDALASLLGPVKAPKRACGTGYRPAGAARGNVLGAIIRVEPAGRTAAAGVRTAVP